MENGKTIGQLALEMHNKPQTPTTFFEQAKLDMSGLDKLIQDAYHIGKKGLPHRDFFIEILIKWERIYQDRVYHILPFVRRSCPTPQYDQTVFRYRHKDDLIEYMWTLPDVETYDWYSKHSAQVPPDEYPLLKYVLDDASGDLLKKVDDINKKLFK